ncbi:transcriptional regulator [Psychromonas sp. CNPT3]|uniref:response regulator transcription factor n=1 Tax=Psychromonas sp. CNPT3 TaxID=314282 RepID=UPI00006E5858|nr:response regulator transcription factor [Psychromonas sp. CNPT3]AGH81939.1 transcriptional regulator [Psychromonas sp. CNPT3]
MKLLIIEDSEPLRRSLMVGFKHLGFSVDTSGDGSTGLSMCLSNDYDFILLDLMLPHVDGISLLKTLRKMGKQAKVIVVSAKSLPADKIDALLSGADDYMTKPFSFDELHARIVSIARRGNITNKNNKISISQYTLDLFTKTLTYQSQLINLTKNEFLIIECLFLAPNRVINIEQISEAVAGSFESLSKNCIEAHLSTIRKKIRQLGAEPLIQNKRGFGYYVSNKNALN